MKTHVSIESQEELQKLIDTGLSNKPRFPLKDYGYPCTVLVEDGEFIDFQYSMNRISVDEYLEKQS